MKTLSDPFAATLARAFQERLLEEKWLLAPSLRVGNQWVDRVAWLGGPVLNVRLKTLPGLMSELAEPRLEQLGLERLPDRGAVLMVERAFRRLRSQLGYLGTLEPSASLAETIYRSLKSLRLAGLSPQDLPATGFEVASKGTDLARLLSDYTSRLEELKLADSALIQRLAVARAAADHGFLASDTVVLLPASLELKPLEQQLIAAFEPGRVVRIPAPPTVATGAPFQCDRDLLTFTADPTSAPAPRGDGSVTFFAALGEVNEVREVLRRVSAEGRHLDQVEVLYTSSSTYVPLFYETLMELEEDLSRAELHPPITFAEGLPCRYSRPGRALQAWVAWIQAGYPQTSIVKMVREALLQVTTSEGDQVTVEDGPGFAATAAALSTVGIGAGRDRYLRQIDASLAALRRPAGGDDAVNYEEEEGSVDVVTRSQLPDHILALGKARTLIAQVLQSTPTIDSPPQQALAMARDFLVSCARATTELDRYASKKLLEEIDEQVRWITLEKDTPRFDAMPWLASLPERTNIMGSGPRPGCLHLAPLLAGGHSGRQRTFVIGLDDRRFPRSGGQDPLLLDSERRKLSSELLTQQDMARSEAREFERLLARLGGQITLGYSLRNLADESELYPSSALLGLHRLVSGCRDVDLTTLQQTLSAEIAAFVPREPQRALDATEVWVSVLAGSSQPIDGERILQAQFPHLLRGRDAVNQRLRAETITADDGLVPDAGARLNPASADARSISASGLETAGKCARRFFFRYGLMLSKPDDLKVDPERWLDPLQQGRLLHRVFEDFLRILARDQQTPKSAIHQQLLHGILDAQMEKFLRFYPPPNASAQRRQERDLRRTADTFLAEEEAYFARSGARIGHLEAALGMRQRGHRTAIDCDHPVSIALGGGLQLRLRGRVDRIDLVGDEGSQAYRIWDYKTGSPKPYTSKEVLTSGKVLQPFLYTAMLEARLRELAESPVAVAGFGFLFPGTAGKGKRLEWTRDQLDTTRDTVRRTCETIASGKFLATTDPQQCRFCDYHAICRADGPLEDMAEASKAKLAVSGGKPTAREGSGDEQDQ